MSTTEHSARLDRGLVTATSLGFAVVQLDVSVVNVAIRPISDALGGGVSALQWVVGAYTITFAALILTCVGAFCQQVQTPLPDGVYRAGKGVTAPSADPLLPIPLAQIALDSLLGK